MVSTQCSFWISDRVERSQIQQEPKEWENQADQTKSNDFVARTKGFSRWIQGVAHERSQPCAPLNLRPDSEVLDFWTMCIPVRIEQELAVLMDDILRNAASRLKTVKSLRSPWHHTGVGNQATVPDVSALLRRWDYGKNWGKSDDEFGDYTSLFI